MAYGNSGRTCNRFSTNSVTAQNDPDNFYPIAAEFNPNNFYHDYQRPSDIEMDDSQGHANIETDDTHSEQVGGGNGRSLRRIITYTEKATPEVRIAGQKRKENVERENNQNATLEHDMIPPAQPALRFATPSAQPALIPAVFTPTSQPSPSVNLFTEMTADLDDDTIASLASDGALLSPSLEPAHLPAVPSANVKKSIDIAGACERYADPTIALSPPPHALPTSRASSPPMAAPAVIMAEVSPICVSRTVASAPKANLDPVSSTDLAPYLVRVEKIFEDAAAALNRPICDLISEWAPKALGVKSSNLWNKYQSYFAIKQHKERLRVDDPEANSE